MKDELTLLHPSSFSIRCARMTTEILGAPRLTWLGRWRSQNQGRIEDWQRGLYRFRQSRLSIVGLAIVLFLIAVAVIGPLFVPYPDDGTGAVHVTERLKAPHATHWFGTDELGRDIFTRVILGTGIALQVGVLVLIVAMSIGIPLGAMAGYFGGFTDDLIMRVTDIFLTIPGLILAFGFAAALGPGLTNAMLAVSLVWWPGFCRLTRGQVLKIREEDYVTTARSLGASHWRVLFIHIIPNSVSPLIVKASLDIGFVILTAAALGFLGIGAQPPVPDWGAMVSYGRKYLPVWWWYAVFPGMAIFITVFGFNLLGDGLRDLLDPRTRR